MFQFRLNETNWETKSKFTKKVKQKNRKSKTKVGVSAIFFFGFRKYFFNFPLVFISLGFFFTEHFTIRINDFRLFERSVVVVVVIRCDDVQETTDKRRPTLNQWIHEFDMRKEKIVREEDIKCWPHTWTKTSNKTEVTNAKGWNKFLRFLIELEMFKLLRLAFIVSDKFRHCYRAHSETENRGKKHTNKFKVEIRYEKKKRRKLFAHSFSQEHFYCLSNLIIELWAKSV